MRPEESERRPMGNYVIVRQGDGNTTLAHAAAGFQAKSERPGHKYVLRIVNAIGTRYFYTKDQVQAYYNAQKKKLEDKTGLTNNATYQMLRKNAEAKKTQKELKKVEKKAEKNPTANNKNLAESSEGNRPQGRKRNVTGTAEPIQKGEATGLGSVAPKDNVPGSNGKQAEIVFENDQTSGALRKKDDKDAMPTADPKHNYVQDRINNLNDQIVGYNEELDKLEAAGHGLTDKETKDYLKQAVPKMVGDAAASYIVTSSERDQADQGMKESYESIQKDLQSIQNDPNASAQAKRYARKVEQDLQEYQEAVDTYNMLCDKNPGGMSKRAQQKMQAEIEKKQKALIKDSGYNGRDASWATDSIEASLDAYKKVSNSSMYTREEMMSYGGLIESMLLTWQKAGLTQEDWDENFKLH